MRARILFVCSLIAITTLALFASPSLADARTIDSITGQATDSSGAPLPGATASLVDASYLEIARTTTDSSGNFSFAGADDRGTGFVKVIVSYIKDGKSYNLTKTPALWYSSDGSPIKISAEETALVNYPPLPESTRPMQVFTVTGQATDANGNQLPGAEVHLFDGIYNEIGVTTSDAGGNFAFTDARAAAPGCKVQVFYRSDGKLYHTDLQNVLWYPTDTGIVKINAADTRIDSYPEPRTGYVWGIITDNQSRTVSGEVYLSGEKRHLSLKTYESGNSLGFISEVPVGEYTVYAVHTDTSGNLESRPVKVLVNPSRNYLEYPALILVVDQTLPPEDLKPVALLGALLIGAALIGGLWYGLRRF